MKSTLYILFVLIISLRVQAQVVITDADLGNSEYNWTSDNEYLLDGYVFLEAGGVLNIEAGTLIKAKSSPSNGDNSSALIIAKGGQIFANGSAEEPIIFTAEFDDGDLTKAEKGLWGGLVILGDATVGVNAGVQNIEGIPSTEGRATYGGSNDSDNSGVLKYVSIRHGGSKLEANNEINGLTLGGVGSATTIDYIEVYANLDDGIELFGGRVNLNHAVVSFCGDDSYDFDQSWNGKGQYWFSLQDQLSNRAGEWDGSESADLGPKVSPVLANLTFIGAGSESMNEDGNSAMTIRDDGSVKVYNSIFTSFADEAIKMDNDADGSTLISDSYDRFLIGDLSFTSNVFFDFGSGSDLESIINTDGGDDALLVTHLSDNGSVFGDPQIAGISREPDGGLDPRINGNSAAWDKGSEIEDDYFESTGFGGAFGSNNWADGWTALAQAGYFGDQVSNTKDLANDGARKSLRVFPNPNNTGHLNIEIELEDSKKIGLSILDMNGRSIKSISKSSNYTTGIYHLSFDVSDLPAGFYTVYVLADNDILSQKLIINK